MTQPIQRLRGTKDLFGPEAKAWERLEAAALGVFARFGYEPIRTPLLEAAALFSRSVGEATDIVQKEMYRFEDRSGDDVALRPEGTAGVVRAYLENHLSQERPVSKLYYAGPMFRAERPQAGRLRQFHQIGAETFGSASALADVETMATLAELLRVAGIKRFRFELNDLGSPEDRRGFTVVLTNFFKKEQTVLCKDCQTRLEKNVFRVLDCKQEACQSVIGRAPRISDHVSDASRAGFKKIGELLTDLQLEWTHNPRIVRGLDYYTHTVFEVKHDGLGAQDALAAGGRYDGLVATLGGPATPAVGFALGVERLFLAAASEAGAVAASDARNGAAVIALGEDAQRGAFGLTQKLRLAGIACEMDLDGRSLKAQLRQADRSGLRYAVILGSTELAKGVVSVKDLSLSESQQREVPLADLIKFFTTTQ